MTSPKKIGYYDLREENRQGKLPALVGRKTELANLTRILSRRVANNCLIVSPSGLGKTTLVYGLISSLCRDKRYQELQFIQLEADELDPRYSHAFASLPPSTLFIDGLGGVQLENSNFISRFSKLLNGAAKRPDVRVILTLESREHAWLESKHPTFLRSFEVIFLKNQSSSEYLRVLRLALPRLNSDRHIIVPTTALETLINYAERFPSLGKTPRSLIALFDECLALSHAIHSKYLTEKIIQTIVSERTGIPSGRLTPASLKTLRNLSQALSEKIIGQEGAVSKITSTVQRALLGMRDPQKPLASFLILGPSGVGKTETAKALAQEIFGRKESFARFDMSEFSQEHTVGRLIGAPPGYLGYETGGALTNALRREPYSLVLLDEIEKAHPKIFDIFLQVLDSGRLTSGQNETVDARHSIFAATSNIAAKEIARTHAVGKDIQSKDFMETVIMPALEKKFRLEFLNRFDAILIFNPLSLQSLTEIALLEIQKIEKRMARHQVRFRADPATLAAKINALADPRFGARPVKRLIEEACESLLVKSLLR